MTNLPRQKATLKRCSDPMSIIKKYQGIVPNKWVISIGDDPFGYYTTKTEALADAREFNLSLVHIAAR